jgi:osmotically inducible protein OsmC
MGAERTASVSWQGTLEQGSGRLRLASGATGPLPVSWASRTQRAEGQTSPEELIAAAHASCFAMALSFGLTQAGTPPESLDVRATCALEETEGGFRIASSKLEVSGVVAGLDEEQFERVAQAAKEGCPVSGALKGNVEITLDARVSLI